MKIWDDTKQYAENIYDDIKGWLPFGHGSHSSSSSTPPTEDLAPTPTPTTSADPFTDTPPLETSTAVEYEDTISSISTTSEIQPTPTEIIEEPVSTFVDMSTPTTTFMPSNDPTASITTSLAPSPTQTSISTTSNSGNNHHYYLIALIIVVVIASSFFWLPFLINLFVFLHNIGKLLIYGSGSFANDSELGLSSETFNLEENIEGQDQRSGLSGAPKMRILWYMFYHKENFDEARFRYVRRQFAKFGIAPDGQPLDPKFVSYEV